MVEEVTTTESARQTSILSDANVVRLMFERDEAVRACADQMQKGTFFGSQAKRVYSADVFSVGVAGPFFCIGFASTTPLLDRG